MGKMKFILTTAAALLALPSIAQTGDGAKYARCAGSTEQEKCRALVDSMAAETPEEKRARAERLERDRASSSKAAAQQPLAKQPPAQSVHSSPAIGMSEREASTTMWGRPESVNRTETRYGTREQWVYGSGRYIYLENGRVTAVSSRH